MALTFTELEAITKDYYLADGKAAIDIYYKPSFLMDYLMKQKKGLWERPTGGPRFRVELLYDVQNGGAYARGDTLSSDDTASLNAAYFYPKYYFGNATIYRQDEQAANGEYEEVSLVNARLLGAQNKPSMEIAIDLFANATDTAKTITGLKSTCSETTSIAYGGIKEDDLVAADGTKPWEGKTTTTTEGISLAVIRTLASRAKIHSGKGGKPDIGVTTETLFNIIAGILQVQQRFTNDTDTAKAGFTNLVFEDKILAADDYCPSGYMFLLNSTFIGFSIYANGYFARSPWADLTVTGQTAKSMKIFWDGNLICNNRKAHAAHSSLS
jgi:hypothetical protein